MGTPLIQSWAVLRSAIVSEFERNPNGFLREPVTTRILHPNQAALASRYHSELDATTHGKGLVALAREPEIGMPRRHIEAGSCSMVAVQHAWQLLQLRTHLAVTPPDLHYVSEVGAGYGDMCRQMHAGGFVGQYTIFDFEELGEIQRRYLAACGVAVRTLPLALGAVGPDPCTQSLLLGTFSIAEMPLEDRTQIEPHFVRYRYLMFSWNESFAGIDNMAWFQGLAERLSGQFDIDIVKDPNMRAWYLYGKARE